MVSTAFVFSKYIWIWLIRSTLHLNMSAKINVLTFFIFAGRRHPTYSWNGLDCICVYKIHVNMINTINCTHLINNMNMINTINCTAFVFRNYMWIWLIRSTVHFNSSAKIKFSRFFVIAGRRHPTYSCNGLDCICLFKIHMNMINTINFTP